MITPGATPTPSTAADINDFHYSHDHMHEDLLRKTAKQIGVKPEGQLVPCQRCSKVKGIRKPVKLVIHTRAVKPAERCFVDLGRPKSVQSREMKVYMMIVRDDFSRFTRVFFLRNKHETAMYVPKYLAEIAPRKVEVIRSDGGGEFPGGAFGLCTTEKNQARIYDSRFPPIQLCSCTPNRNHRGSRPCGKDSGSSQVPHRGFIHAERVCGPSKLNGLDTY